MCMSKMTCPIEDQKANGLSHAVDSFEFDGEFYHVNLGVQFGEFVFSVLKDVPESAETGLMLDVTDSAEAREIAEAAAETTSLWAEHKADAAEYAAEDAAWQKTGCDDESLAP